MWKAPVGDSAYNIALAAKSLRALAISGRPEVMRIVEEIMTKADLAYQANMNGMVMTVFFMREMMQKYGREGCIALMKRDYTKEYKEWRSTPEGQKLRAWYDDVDARWVEQKSGK